MDPLHRSIIDRNLVPISADLHLTQVIPYLQSRNVFQEWHEEEIQSKTTQSEKRQHCLKLVKTRGPYAFRHFYDACIDTHQYHIAKILEEGIHPSERRPHEDVQPQPPPIAYPAPPPRITFPPSDRSSPSGEEGWVPNPGHGEGLPSEEALAYSENYYKVYDSLRVEQTAGELENLSVNACQNDSLPPGVNNNLSAFDHKEIYPNFSKPKGLCIIFNNRRFENNILPERHGTDVDAANAKKLFTQLGYDVKVKNDHTAGDMLAAMGRFSLKDHGKYDSAVVIVLTHGLHGQLYGSDGRLVSVESLTTALNPHHCTKLINKPKLFFLQACRGEEYDPGVHHPDGPAGVLREGIRDGMDPLDIIKELNSRDEEDALFIKKKVPLDADFLIAYATTPGYVSWRNSARGSWFVQAICEVFARHADSDHVGDLLTRVNNRVVDAFTASSGLGYKQMPEHHNRLRRKFFFFPGLERP